MTQTQHDLPTAHPARATESVHPERVDEPGQRTKRPRAGRGGRIVSLLAAGVVALLLAGCSSPAPTETETPAPTVTTTVTPSTPPSSSAPSSTSSSGTTASSASTPAASTAPATRITRCAASDLQGSLGSGDGAAGSTSVDLQLQNTGSKPCTLQGWPGTSFIDADGHQIGAAADFDRASSHGTVTLIPNAHAHAALKIADAQNYSSSKCSPATVRTIRVYPPGSRASLTIAAKNLTGCRTASVHLLTVQALHPTT